MDAFNKNNLTDGCNFKADEVSGESFVDVRQYLGEKVVVEMQYALAKIKGATEVAYLRREVADRLLIAAKRLPFGMRFKIYDAWRPYAVQKSLYDQYFNRLKEEHPDLSEQELHERAKSFVSYPDASKRISFVHSSGGAVDITVIDERGQELDMGTAFDEFSPLSRTSAFDNTDGKVSENRAILYNAMTAAGFTNYQEEWWHYDYGDLFWAQKTGKEVKYCSVYAIEEMIIWR